MGDFHALELVHAANPLADEAELGRVHTPVADRGVEDIRKHPPICGVRAPNARREQGDLIVRGPLRQGIGERGAVHRKRRRSRGPLAFQALVALHATGDVVDGFALLPDQWDAVDAAIALVQEGHIVNEAIGQRYPPKPLGPLAVAEHGEKLCVRRCHCRHAHQPHEHGGHEHAPPLSLQVHPLVLPKSWRSSRSHASIAWGGGHVQCTWVSITVQTAYFSEPLAPNGMGISRSAFFALSAACPCWAASLRCGSQRTRSSLADKNISTSANACWFWSREKPPWPPPGIVISFSATRAFRSASCKRTDCE
jgi:hypothetical protein